MSRPCSTPACERDRYTATADLCEDHAQEIAHAFIACLGQKSGVAWTRNGVEVDWDVILRVLRPLQFITSDSQAGLDVEEIPPWVRKELLNADP